MQPPHLADVHVHLYGCLGPEHVWAALLHKGERLDLGPYETAYSAAFGAASPVRDLMARHRAGDASAATEFRRVYTVNDDDGGAFARFAAKFGLIIAATEFATARDPARPAGEALPERLFDEIARVVGQLRDAMRSHGVAYSEYRLLLSNEPRFAEWPRVAEAVHRGAGDAMAGEPIVRLAPSLPRRDPWPQWESVQQAVLGPHGHLITAVDFSHVEEGDPPRGKAAFFAAVRAHNARHPARALAMLHHVGESFTDKSLESAIRWVQESAELGAHRLGHAIALGIDPDAFGPHERYESVAERRDQIRYDLHHADGLDAAGVRVDRGALEDELEILTGARATERVSYRYDDRTLDLVRKRQGYAIERVRATGAIIEVCPTSNVRIGGLTNEAHHPVRRFLRAGLPVAVASDDPGIFDTDLHAEIAHVARIADLGEASVATLAAATWNARSEVVSGREVST